MEDTGPDLDSFVERVKDEGWTNDILALGIQSLAEGARDNAAKGMRSEDGPNKRRRIA